MTVERARIQAVHKPWGRNDLLPWYERRRDGIAIGELWFQRADETAADTALLLKLLFTEAPLSIQVHPDDAFARSIGLPNGKTEAWYVLAAKPDARIALGLKQPLTAPQLRAAIADGSIETLVDWRPIVPDEVVVVPAGTIHALGAGLVIAEIQQRSDATFRLFDYGRGRPLDIEKATAVAKAEPAAPRTIPTRQTDARTVLVSSIWFGLERVELIAHSTWRCQARHETWLLVLSGAGKIGGLDVSIGEAIFLRDADARITVGSAGMKCLLAYVGAEPPPLLSRGPDCQASDAVHDHTAEVHP